MGGTFLDLDASHYCFDNMEFMAEALKNPYENMKALEKIITTQVAYDQIPIDTSLFFLKGAEKKSYIPLTVNIPYSACIQKEIEGKIFLSLNLLIQVSNKLGLIIFEKSKDLNVKHSSEEMEKIKTETIYAQTSFSLGPEAYNIRILVLDNYSGKVGTILREIVVPDFDTKELRASDIILYGAGDEGKNNELIAGQEKSGTIKHDFKLGEEMTVYFEAYNLALGPESKTCDFEVIYEYFDRGKPVLSIPAPRKTPSSERDIRVKTSFMLKNFKPGKYTLKVKITDLVSGTTTSKDIQFFVTP
jgi:hypothetical protein